VHISSFYYTKQERQNLLDAGQSDGMELIHDNHIFDGSIFSHGELIMEDTPSHKEIIVDETTDELIKLLDSAKSVSSLRDIIKRIYFGAS
tara:strand:+ start:270 stop:539 length:270 start_codon:yes stop_codon:yes gene_type:complete